MIYLIGAGGQGRVTAEVFLLGGVRPRVLDEDPALRGQKLAGIEIEEEAAVLPVLMEPVEFFVAIGNNRDRRRLVERWEARGHCPIRAIHPSAVVSPLARLDAGTCVMAGAVVQIDSRIGKGAIVNTAASVDHECSIGAWAHVAPGVHLAGGVTVGTGAFIGIGSSVREGITVGENALVGAGSAVVRDVPPAVVAHGNPCRVIRKRSIDPPPRVLTTSSASALPGRPRTP